MNTSDLRHMLAAECSEAEVERRFRQCDGVVRALEERGLYTGESDRVFHTDKEINLLRCVLRYEYADDMLRVAGENCDE